LITLTWNELFGYFIAACAGFTSICVAFGWVVKIVKGAKKPGDDIRRKLDNDNDRIKSLESQFAFVLKAISLLLQDDLVILNHLRTDNNTGEMAKQESKVQEFLVDRE